MIIQLSIPGKITGKGRPKFSVRGKGNKQFVSVYTPKTTQNYEAHVRACYLEQCGTKIAFPAGVPIHAMLRIGYSIPQSYTKKKRTDIENGLLLPAKKPDIDNIIKVCLDALNKIAFHDDAQVTHLTATKEYVEDGDSEGVFIILEDTW